ncbi:MAG: thymidine phosphorylase family protein [Alphaproteobacteria bacterium]|nr:thymidine phosphorylase family protein [Alphaproteobacteria bacterium]NCQ66181.1 thymidine phosphorylase family protein [Alphaproteobacteria bacterium]NCT06529.1 thymidine phosphorylase family protein [Alphaproteobacteria bacterium]
MTLSKSTLHLKRLGIDTYKEAVVYMREDCHVCLAEGFEVQARVKVSLGERSIIATLNMIKTDFLDQGRASLSEHAWHLLAAREGDEITVTHAKSIPSLSLVRSKIYGNALSGDNFCEIIKDITFGRYSDIHISSFLTACAGGRLSSQEIIELTQAMVTVGDRLSWPSDIVVDKHCVGGLPGNRTTPIIVSIVAAFGLTMPKTSSRAITSPAGTADTMEVLAPVELDALTLQNVVKKEKGCIVWGGSVSLSPADDMIIHVERALDLDSEGQLVASVLSKKIAAGSTHVLIDIPIGPTAKVRSQKKAHLLKDYLESVGKSLGIVVKIIFSDGTQPVGRGVGPALEARDLVSVLKLAPDAPQDLRERSLVLAGHIIEFSPDVKEGEGLGIATQILDSGQAWEKFQRICEAQGGMREIPKAPFTYVYKAKKRGTVMNIDNRRLALVAKFAGAPSAKAAGIDLSIFLGKNIEKGDGLFTVHANSPGELAYALGYLHDNADIITMQEG